ncbi:MAG: arylesterase [Rhizobiales bacterium]|nr:arylesterase [Hyphomicrobiales bacterium]
MQYKTILLTFFTLIATWLFSQPLHASQTFVIASFGDSLSAGYRLPPEGAFPVQLQKTLRAKGLDVEVLNAAVSGDTTTGALARLDWSIGENVQAVIIELGANDALRGVNPTITRDALNKILTRFQERGIKVLLAGMLAPPNLGPDFGNSFNAIYPDLAQKYDVLLYPFFLENVAADPSLNLSDGIHPTMEGIGIIVDSILPSVEALLDSIEPAS